MLDTGTAQHSTVVLASFVALLELRPTRRCWAYGSGVEGVRCELIVSEAEVVALHLVADEGVTNCIENETLRFGDCSSVSLCFTSYAGPIAYFQQIRLLAMENVLY